MTLNPSNFRNKTLRKWGEIVAGVELDNDTISTTQSERWFEWHQTPSNFRKMLRKRGVIRGEMEKTDCGWSGTQQQHSRNEQQRSCGWSGATTMTQQRSERCNKKTSKPLNFRNITKTRRIHGDTVAGAALQQRHRSSKPEKKPSWNVCSNGIRRRVDVESALGCV
jgi:hypothetical protein